MLMKLTLSILSYLAGLSILAPAGWAATHEITTKNFHITLLGNGDGPEGWTGTRDWSTEQIDAVTTTLNIWDDTFRNTASRKIEATISWGALGQGVLAESYSNYVDYEGGSYNTATSTEVIWKEGGDAALAEGETDFRLQFNPAYGFSVADTTPANATDFISVLLHEIGHNVGFNSMNYDGAYGDSYTIWDSLITYQGNHPGDPNFHYETGISYTIGSGGLTVYNPFNFAPGSSMAHVNASSDPDALMQYSIGEGIQRRDPSDKEKALLAEMGWVLKDDPTYYASVDGASITNQIDLDFFTSVLVNRNMTIDPDNGATIVLPSLRGDKAEYNVTITAGKSLTVNLSNTEMDSFCVGAVIGNDANFTKTGEKNLALAGGFSTTGTLDVREGALVLSGATNTIGELTINGGIFGVSKLAREATTAEIGKLTGTKGSINLLQSSLTLTGTDNTISSGLKLVGTGTIALAEGKSLTFDGSNTIGDAIYIDGTQNGTLHITQGTLSFTNQARMEIATLALDSGTSTLNAGTTQDIVIHSITGDGALAAQGGKITLDLANPLTWNGTLQGTGTLSKKGTGDLTLAGTGNAGFHLDSTSGSIILTSESSAYGAMTLNGGGISISHTSSTTRFTGKEGTLTLNDATLSMSGTANTLTEQASITGTGILRLNGDSMLAIRNSNKLDTDITVAGSGLVVVQEGTFTLSGKARFDGTAVAVGPESAAATLNLGSTRQSVVGGLLGKGSVIFNNGELALHAEKASAFAGSFQGNGTINKAGKAAWTYTGAGLNTLNLNITEGEVALIRDSANPVLLNSLTVGSTGTLTLAMESASAAHNTTLLLSGTSQFMDGSTITLVINPLLAQNNTPFISTEDGATLTIQGDRNGTTLNIESNVAASERRLELVLFEGDMVGSDLNINAYGALGTYYSNLHAENREGQVVLTGTRKADNALLATADTSNSVAGAVLLWNCDNIQDGTELGYLNRAVSDAWNDGDYARANRLLSASAGTAIPGILAAQRSGLRREMTFIRNRAETMGLNPNYIQGDIPQVNGWIEANAGRDSLDSSNEGSGFTLNSWGGTAGLDVNCSENFTLGAAFSANYGDYSSNGADYASGDLDTYYVSLFGHYRHKKWGHSLILSGGWSDADITRDVRHDLGSYQTSFSTSGMSFGAMYELTYDLVLNKRQTTILQPVANVSVMHSSVDGFNEAGAGGAGLRVDDMDITTGSIAAGLRLKGVLGTNLTGRDITGEFRALVSQDFGDDKAQANVAYLANPGLVQTIRGAKLGRTGVQLGVGLNIPCSDYGTVYVDGNADLRSGDTSIGGALGYRYNF
ncbi:autotransporter domain-containing protein [uncultured Akkermansia sp.]|uniref:autotransporter domain-containing protein n=1 Tax=uncultured Akkermansia sp. TaxID=512294 RepID=UPI00265D5A75|nr:autotransporter domain-containing protein [uncultured Akkermansia sp.]